MSFTGGKLKLKGNKSATDIIKTVPGLKPNVNDKRKRESSPEKPSTASASKESAKSTQPALPEEEKIEKKRIIVDFKTDYEKKIALQKQHIMKDVIDKKLKSTHREKIEQYNKNLAKIPEHFDIPKVGPG